MRMRTRLGQGSESGERLAIVVWSGGCWAAGQWCWVGQRVGRGAFQFCVFAAALFCPVRSVLLLLLRRVCMYVCLRCMRLATAVCTPLRLLERRARPTPLRGQAVPSDARSSRMLPSHCALIQPRRFALMHASTAPRFVMHARHKWAMQPSTCCQAVLLFQHASPRAPRSPGWQ